MCRLGIIKMSFKMAIAPIITSIANVWRGEELAARLEYKIRAVLKAFDLKTAAADSIPMDLARFAKISYGEHSLTRVDMG